MSMEIPEHLRTGPMAEQAAKALQDAQSMASASNSVPRISIRGREFRLVENGEEGVKFRDYLDVIILGVEPEAGKMVKTFYAKGYQSGSKEPPTCSSDDGIVPAPYVTDKQSQTCSSCPKNAWGSATSPNGKATKACRDSKRIWIKLAGGNMVGATECDESKKPLSERTLYGLNVSVASLKSFSDHGRQLTQLGQPPAVCVTRMTMQDKEYPELAFSLQAWLGVEEAPKALEMSAARPWKAFKAAGLALAAPVDGGPKQALPGQLPSVPDHLKPQAPAVQDPNVIDAQATPVSNAAIDDQIKNW